MARWPAEDYVRPPLVARELPSTTLAIWRFRVGALLLLALLTLAVTLLFLHFSGVTAEDPGLSGSLSPAHPAAL
ncbi:MAG: hypothetical protein JWM02_2415 [Frankiales bacterium]|nr:hypothetical protein [Frankiales bacterium]